MRSPEVEPTTPRDLTPSRQNCCMASQLGAASQNPQPKNADGRWTRHNPAIPAAESALGLRPRRALPSAQVFPEWTTLTPPCNNFSANGANPLNSLSHSRGSLQTIASIPCNGVRITIRPLS
jgi:hypothetical protein